MPQKALVGPLLIGRDLIGPHPLPQGLGQGGGRLRLEQVQQTEEAAAEEALDRLDRKLEQTMRAVEASYEKNKERWVDTLFSMIVGTEP